MSRMSRNRPPRYHRKTAAQRSLHLVGCHSPDNSSIQIAAIRQADPLAIHSTIDRHQNFPFARRQRCRIHEDQQLRPNLPDFISLRTHNQFQRDDSRLRRSRDDGHGGQLKGVMLKSLCDPRYSTFGRQSVFHFFAGKLVLPQEGKSYRVRVSWTLHPSSNEITPERPSSVGRSIWQNVDVAGMHAV